MLKCCRNADNRRDPYPAAGVVQLVEGGGEIAPPPPECSKCGNFVRPGVVLWGAMLPEGVLEWAGQAAREADVALVSRNVIYGVSGGGAAGYRGGPRRSRD